MKRVTSGGPTARACTGSRFNPHPREAGDKPKQPSAGRIRRFNPHPREAGDTRGGGGVDVDDVSIHTRVKRVTRTGQRRVRDLRGFNPHPREAGDASGFPRHQEGPQFQSTPA